MSLDARRQSPQEEQQQQPQPQMADSVSRLATELGVPLTEHRAMRNHMIYICHCGNEMIVNSTELPVMNMYMHLAPEGASPTSLGFVCERCGRTSRFIFKRI